MDVGNFISGSSAFSKSSLNIWKFTVHVLLKPGLEIFEHYFTNVLLLSCFSRVRLCAAPLDGSPPGFPVPGILQARTLEWVAISFSNAWKWKVKSENEVTQSCLTLWDPMDCHLPGSSIHGIFQARVLEWGATAFSTSVLDECSCLVVWALFGIDFLRLEWTMDGGLS